MKRSLLVFFVVLTLAACASTSLKPATIRYKLTFKNPDLSVQNTLMQEALKVVEGRVEHLQKDKLFTVTPSFTGSSAFVTVRVKDAVFADALTAELTRPLKFRLMVLAEKGEPSDLTLDSGDAYRETGLTEKHLLGVRNEGVGPTGKARVQIQFDEKGHEKIAEVAKQFPGKKLGIFVRDLPMTFLKIIEYKGDDFLVENIPSPAIAEIFTHDMNVSLGVTFTPIKIPE